jgi:hypothetical protein
MPHLFSPAGFTDDSWWHRTYWIYGTAMQSGWGGWPRSGYVMPAGRLLVADDDRVFGFGRLNQYANHGSHIGVPLDLIPWPPSDQRARGTTHYRLFATPKKPDLAEVNGPQTGAAKKKPAEQQIQPTWSEVVPVTARAMVLAGQTLFLAGPPELLALSDGTTAGQDLAAAAEAYQGRRGALLCAVAADSGQLRSQRSLDSPPVFDGLIAAGGRLYLVTVDGKIHCWEAASPL